jgi:hypothetical protein
VNYATPLNRGAAITKYAATCVSSNGGATRTGVHIGASAAPITVTGATLARRYRCSVQAFNAKGASPAAMSGTITVGAPAQVSSVNATKVQSGRLRVTFRNLTPADANGSPLITPKYTATCKSGIGFTRTGVGAASPIYVGGLLTGQGYTCTVVAHNARGFSAPSDPSWWVTV